MQFHVSPRMTCFHFVFGRVLRPPAFAGFRESIDLYGKNNVIKQEETNDFKGGKKGIKLVVIQ